MAYDPKRDVAYLFGGDYAGCGSCVSNDLSKYDVKTDTWDKVLVPSPLPIGQGGVGLDYDTTNDVLILFGGSGELHNNLNGVWVYDPLSNSWTDMDVLPDGISPRPPNEHIYGRFKYDPVNNATFLVVVGNSGIETWAYRYKKSSTPPDTTPPGALSGIGIN